MSERRNLAVASLIALSLGWAGTASAQEIKLTLADQNSPTAWGPSHALQPWVKQVEEATKGRVKIEVYPSQTLIKGVDMWKGIRGGIADIGWCVQGYWPEQTPLSDVMSRPFLPVKSAEKASEAFWKLYEKFPIWNRRYRLVRARLLAGADAALRRDVASLPAGQVGREGQRGILEAVREISDLESPISAGACKVIGRSRRRSPT